MWFFTSHTSILRRWEKIWNCKSYTYINCAPLTQQQFYCKAYFTISGLLYKCKKEVSQYAKKSKVKAFWPVMGLQFNSCGIPKVVVVVVVGGFTRKCSDSLPPQYRVKGIQSWQCYWPMYLHSESHLHCCDTRLACIKVVSYNTVTNWLGGEGYQCSLGMEFHNPNLASEMKEILKN